MVFVNESTTLADLCGTADDVVVRDPLAARTVADLINTLEEVEIPEPQGEILEAQVLQHEQEVSW